VDAATRTSGSGYIKQEISISDPPNLRHIRVQREEVSDKKEKDESA